MTDKQKMIAIVLVILLIVMLISVYWTLEQQIETLRKKEMKAWGKARDLEYMARRVFDRNPS